MENAYFSLLKQWCDELLKLQLKNTGMREIDGGIICPACHIIHGRCHDALYPFMYLADKTGDAKYLNAARALFDWSENLLVDDKGLYNDAQNPWQGITVFSTNNLCHALRHHGHLLTSDEKLRWETRLMGYGEWLCEVITPDYDTVINYDANCAGAMALLGEYFDCDKFREHAQLMAAHSIRFLSENDLLTGEGKPCGAVTPRGCQAIDIGYNVEESLAALLRYAIIQGDAEIKEKVIASMRAHLEFMMPDGGWDNSFGTRNFKWTYWGSRTSDGCQVAYAALGAEIPEFAEAAYRNLKLYEKCSEGGLMFGGPHYKPHGEKACTHHSFCHAAALAAALDNGIEDFERCKIPADAPPAVKYWPEIDTWKLAAGPFRATVTGYDFEYMQGGHVSGGVMSMLWHEKTGPVLATGMTDYSLAEATNMQLSLKKSAVASLAPRLDISIDGKRYSQMYDYGSDISVKEANGIISVDVACSPVDINHNSPVPRPAAQLRYEISENCVSLVGWVSGSAAANSEFVLPVILSDDEEYILADEHTVILKRDAADVRIVHSGIKPAPRRIFNFSGGFTALELRIVPDSNGNFIASVFI